MLVGPFNETGGITCVFKRMSERGGKRLPDELLVGTMRVVEDANPKQLRVRFQLGDFPDHAMFWRTADGVVAKLKQHCTVHGCESGEARVRGKRPPKKEIVERRNRVAELAGKSMEQIAEQVSVSVSTISRDLKVLGMVTPRRK